jgi:Spy/CpxP family protein refolding chaperone
MEADFTLTKDQKKAIKTLFDDAYKTAEPVRDALAKAHASLGAAIQAKKDQTEIDAAIKSYAEQAAAMTSIEIKALADMLKTLTEQQRSNNAAVSRAFFLMRGAFLEKKWDDIPTGHLY